MAVELEVQALDDVPEALKGFYIEDENSEGEKVFRLNVEGMTKKVANHQQVLDEKRKAVARLQEVMQELGDQKPTEVLKRLKELEAAEADRNKQELHKKGDFEKLRKQLEADHAKALEALEAEKAELEAELAVNLVDNEAVMAIDKLGGRAKPLLPHIQRQTEIVVIDGSNGKRKRVARVKDPENPGGHRTYIKTGEPMTIEQLVEEMREDQDFAPLFDSDGRAGSGAPPKSGSSSAAPRSKGGVITLTREEAKDPAKYRAAQKQAQEAGARIEYTDA